MTAFHQVMPDTPQWPDQDTMDLRVRLKAEEFCEWLMDSGYEYVVNAQRVYRVNDDLDSIPVFDSSTIDMLSESTEENRELPKSADALIDDLYVTVGALLAMGIDMWPLWDAVHAANMAKIGGPVVNGKQMKPEGWKAPDIEALMREQGWSE